MGTHIVLVHEIWLEADHASILTLREEPSVELERLSWSDVLEAVVAASWNGVVADDGSPVGRWVDPREILGLWTEVR